MICPHCAFSNPTGAKFCSNCGRPLARTCPNCGQPADAAARFCGNCGYNLAGTVSPVAPPRLTDLQSAAPAPLQEKMRAARAEAEGERKLVTALFADIVGSTEIAESLDPEDWREIVSGAHQRLSEAIYRYEGTIAQLLGDGVLAFFGAPLAHEDDPERAVRAALEILEAIELYAAELRERSLTADLRMRIGLNTGLVVVGNIGSDLHMEYLAVGDTVNLAARMQSAAAPGSTLISEHTYRLVPSLFDFEDGGKITVKGKSDPVQVYRVLGERKGAVKSRGIAGLSSPMVGRQRESAVLDQVAADLRRGQGSIVSILGEAGLGKSRLMAEWRKRIVASGESPIRWVEGRCLSYGSAIAYHLATDLLRALVGANADSSDEELKRGLQATIRRCCTVDPADVFPYLGHILGVPLDPDDAARIRFLDGPALQARYIAAFVALLRAIAMETPTIVVCEDIHWADVSSVELGVQVLPIAAELPLAFVFVARPDTDVPGWKLVQAAREIPGVGAQELHLSPLSELDSRRLVANLLDVASLPAPVQSLIMSKAEGNPFYVEEVIRMLIDHGTLARTDGRWVATREVRDIEIPDTLQGVIMARIDRLPEEAKHVLQIASVIGRRFQVRVLEMVIRSEAEE